jgi:hypothetical protein
MQRHICVFKLPSNFVDTDKRTQCAASPTLITTSRPSTNTIFTKVLSRKSGILAITVSGEKTLLDSSILIPYGKIILSYVV